MTGNPPRDWTDIHWPDIDATVARRWIAVLPLAATEQHGPHLPLATDVMIADAYLAKVREFLPADLPATFLPVQPVGISTEHINFPGTLTLAPATAIAQWMALGESVARAGVKKLMIVTSPWSRFGVPPGLFPDEELRHGIHGGAVETSIMLARFAEHVRNESITDFRPASIDMVRRYRWLSTQRPAPFAWQVQDLHPSGAVGNATLATAEKGELLIEHGARAFCELLAEVDNFDVRQLGQGPAS